jgi:hypothetical protein
MKTFALAAACVATLGLSGLAHADPQQTPGRYEASVVYITGRHLQPSASIELTKARPKLVLSELRQPLVARVAQAVTSDPF